MLLLNEFSESRDNDYQTDDIFLKKIATGKIKKSKNKNISIQHTFNFDFSISNKYILAVIDADNIIAESDETNNIIFYLLP